MHNLKTWDTLNYAELSNNKVSLAEKIPTEYPASGEPFIRDMDELFAKHLTRFYTYHTNCTLLALNLCFCISEDNNSWGETTAVLSKHVMRRVVSPMNTSFPLFLVACRSPVSTWGFQTESYVLSAVQLGLNGIYDWHLVKMDFFPKHPGILH